MPPGEVPTAVPIGYLLMAIGSLASACIVLFYLLLESKKETLSLAREVIPLATTLQTTVQVLQKLLEKAEQRGIP